PNSTENRTPQWAPRPPPLSRLWAGRWRAKSMTPSWQQVRAKEEEPILGAALSIDKRFIWIKSI
ncbi:hypothetical protein, partial [Achromobacter ruhlandii]|uniref:hypothetical protein n=1 Tax=Achromobacter ruhlandii TaxID=72557 RepID=UPI003B9AABC1